MTEAISQKGCRQTFDVIVFGSGLSGLAYVLAVAEARPACRIALITKHDLLESNSRYAQGGIASATLSEDSFAEHMNDTLKAGHGLCDPVAVKKIVEAAPEAIQFLMDMGVVFDRNSQGECDLGKEGGHRFRRIYHVGDETGRAMTVCLAERVKSLSTVTVFEHHVAVNLITRVEKHAPGARREVIGAYVLDERSGLIDTFLANVVVLATGGAGKVYRYTSNPSVSTGDGIAMAYRAGARVGNMEFYQFHPTLLYHHELNNFLISEALRGEGGYLRRADTLERFMQAYAPDAMEMATRDVVARAIFSELEHSEQKFVYLDMTHLDKTFLQTRFPTIYNTLHSIGIAMEKDYIPVVPAAHFCCGGVLADVSGNTDLIRLLAIGETAFTGLHGANRLPCNALLETIVMGRLAAEASLPLIDDVWTSTDSIQDWDSNSVIDDRRASQIHAHWRSLRGEMTSYAGIVRTKEGLSVLLNLILTRREMIDAYYWRHWVTRDVLELRNILQVAEVIVRSALARHESRGGHYREDYPHTLVTSDETIFRNSRESRITSTMHERPTE